MPLGFLRGHPRCQRGPEGVQRVTRSETKAKHTYNQQLYELAAVCGDVVVRLFLMAEGLMAPDAY